MSEIDDIKSWIDEIMKNESIETFDLNILGNSLKGDGYSGDITFVNIKAPSKSYDLVIKCIKKSDELRKRAPLQKCYLREIYVYSQIFQKFEQFQLENSIREPFKKYPKCHKVCEEEKKESLIFENLKTQGFQMHNPQIPMNLSHIQFVLKEYAKFHGISLAMKQLKPELFRNLTKNMDNIFREVAIQTNMLSSFGAYMKKAVNLLNSNEAKKFEGYEEEIDRIFTKTTYDIEDPLTIILHGDCWNNNLMFKYDESDKTKPSDMRFLDFQISRTGHLLMDLSFFLYTCCDEEALESFDSLLELYYSTLSNSLSQYGININKLFTLAKLKQDWKTVGKYGIYMACLGIQFVLCDRKDAIDLAKVAESDQDFGKSFIAIMKNDERYDNRIRPILKHFSEKFL